MYKFESGGRVFILKKWMETFPDGHTHPILEDPEAKEGWHNNTQEIVVKEGHYFGMGDNRDHSMDCRWEKEVGQIPEERLVGRAEIYIFSISAKLAEFWKWPFSIRFDRIMMQIR
jgi:signal peptidase I